MTAASFDTRTYPAHAVAIIGVSGLFPGARDNVDELFRLLCDGRDLVGPVPPNRREDSGVALDVELLPLAAVDRIDLFDPELFRMSQREAELTDPQQRWALQLACQAIWNAGYSLREMRGTSTAVVIALGRPNYQTLFTAADSLAVTGMLPAMAAGRIAYHLDLRGAAMVVDTSCSSSLVAVHEACAKVASGEATYAIAGGIRLNAVFEADNAGARAVDVLAPDGRTKAFDAKADGTGVGEGGAIVLLKRLDRAVRDRDHIHAVIRGSAVNHDGGRSVGLAAPSPAAQTEVLQLAWRRAEIAPSTLGYIEAHGTGTRLGDPIEMQAIGEAFGDEPARAERCAIGSIKTNIGHLDAAAGIAGLLKATLSIAHGTIPRSLNFERLNPLIDPARCRVDVATERRPWPAGIRRAGVSAFGITGTNVHIVLEEAPEPDPSRRGSAETLVTLSARSTAALTTFGDELRHAIARQPWSLGDIAHVLNRGRDDHAVRCALVVREKADLARALDAAVDNRFAEAAVVDRSRDTLIVMTYSGDADLVDVAPMLSICDEAAAAWDRCLAEAARLGIGEEDPSFVRARRLAMQVALERLWSAFGIEPAVKLASGHGQVAVDLAARRLGIEEALRKVTREPERPPAIEKLDRSLRSLATRGRCVLLELGAGGWLGRAADQIGIPDLAVLDSVGVASGGLLQTLSRLYMRGAAIDWEKFYEGRDVRRVPLPPVPFELRRCWADVPSRASAASQRPQEVAGHDTSHDETARAAHRDPRLSPTEQTLSDLWARALKADHVDIDSDYFDLGGSSLSYSQFVLDIERLLGVRLALEDLYEHATVRTLARRIDEIARVRSDAEQKSTAVNAETPEPLPLSSGQLRMWFLQQAFPTSSAYNVPIALRLRGPLDARRLERSLNALVARHASLRTTFIVRDHDVLQMILPAWTLTLDVERLSESDAIDRDEITRERLESEAKAPFALAEAPPVRARLFQLRDRDQILVLTFHHIVIDEWSVGVLLEELSQVYAALATTTSPSLPSVECQFPVFAQREREWLAAGGARRSLAYWREQLRDVPPTVPLPYDRPRPQQQTLSGRWHWLRLSSTVTSGLRDICRVNGASLFMGLLAALETLIYRYTAADDFAIACPVANRTSGDVARTIGCFINTVLMRADTSGRPTFRELLDRVRATARDAYAHQDAPFDKVVDMLQVRRDGRTAPLVNVYFSFQTAAAAQARIPGLELDWIQVDTSASWGDLTLVVWEEPSGELTGFVSYADQLFDATTIERLVGNFIALVGGVVDNPNLLIDELPLLAEVEEGELSGMNG